MFKLVDDNGMIQNISEVIHRECKNLVRDKNKSSIQVDKQTGSHSASATSISLLENISGQLGMCRHNNPWAHVYCTINQWPTGHVQTQQSMGSCLLYNESVANWACADTTIHGLMFIVQ